MIQILTDNQFEQTIQDGTKTIVVDFWAEWCGPCKQLTPTLENVANEFSDTIDVYKMNIDENPNTPTALGIRGIPTLIMFKGGKAFATKSGNMPKNVLTEWITDNMG